MQNLFQWLQVINHFFNKDSPCIIKTNAGVRFHELHFRTGLFTSLLITINNHHTSSIINHSVNAFQEQMYSVCWYFFSFCHNSRSTALRQLWRCITQSSSRSRVFTAAPMLGCMPPSATSTRSRGLGLSCHHHGYQSSALWRRLRWQNKAVSHSKEHWSERSEGADRKAWWEVV